MQEPLDAIVMRDVVKSFRKRTIRGEYTTFKSELMRWFRGQRVPREAGLISALRGINLRIPRGKTVGIIGRNGSGKSTLLKLITGIYAPSSGVMEINGRISALLDLGAGFHPDFSGRENILINGIILGMSRAEVRARMDAIIAFSELGEFIDEPVRTYSSGMYMRLAFAVATHVDPDILIVDEILAVGDEHFSKKSVAKMTEFKRQGKTIVLVTHDLSTVERWCDLAIWIDGGYVRRVGRPSEIVTEYRQAIALAEAQSVAFTPPALTEGGGALPEVHSVVGGDCPVRIAGLRLVDASGGEAQNLSPDMGVEVCVDFSARSGCEDVEFEVSLQSPDGRPLYETSTRLEAVPLPRELPPSGRMRLVLERLGLLAGTYVLVVTARTAGGMSTERRTFEVSSNVAERGVFRPAHHWVVEPVPVPVESSLAGGGHP
ncbi:O-antigen ABC exporter, ATP-binding protein [Myxococcus stipitatus DSM 14675]|uniref:O-antigen ABC exporter, ATP-binding protein n=1 Tax=Myxococcus stipitatus (strain DSM 14675 / JCM 12634 / Mx s8) TaxID=1278073 RepID=L7UBT8_MYXSD|nr:ABC transporter ATP-binding protein [Myxococcus stipitatus]AGC46361.1 O-antigen ABC exporter, ATP-binding protein [Myxococcus stipitatus DSM 14675]